MEGRTDPVAAIESSYRVGTRQEEWLAGVADAVRPAFDRGQGIFAYCFQAADSPGRQLGPLVERNLHPDFVSQFVRVNQQFSQEFCRRAHLAGPIDTTSRIVEDLPRDRELLADVWGPMRMQDALGITATDGTGAGCILVAPCPTVCTLSAGERATWSRIAAHIAAGYRLQRLVEEQGGRDPVAEAEAILEPDGRLQHATGPAKRNALREALREAAVAVTRAGGRLRRDDPTGAVAAWRALVAGRWSLVDHFDRDGRKFLIARRNDPQSRVPAGLTLRERQVLGYACLGHSNKLIGYELGLSPTTVSTHLARAAQKLGADSRPALIRLATTPPGPGAGAGG